MRTLITFATSEYAGMARRQAESAVPFFDRVAIHTPSDLTPEFYASHPKHRGTRRGFMLWRWKPHFVLQHLLEMSDGDELVYADSQVIWESDPTPMFKTLAKHGSVGLFHQQREGHVNSTFTRGDCFRIMGCDEPKYWDGDNLAATFSLWTRDDFSIAFAGEWQHWCDQYDVVSDGPDIGPNRPGFQAHRHDQSILSNLAIKHDLFTLCDPSQFGDGYRCAECQYPRIVRVDRRVIAPWLMRPSMSSIIEVSAIATCPLRCTYCPQDKLGAAYAGEEKMSMETFTACLDHLTPGDAIYFAGFTEPALNPHLVEMLELCIARGHRTRLYTTGRGLSLENAKKIAAMQGIEMVVLHLPDAHGSLRNSPANVPILEALANHPRCECMAMNNAAHAEVGHLWNSMPVNWGPMHDRAGTLDPKVNAVSTPRHRGPIKCGVAPQLDHSVLLPDGRLACCCMDYSLAHIVGDLTRDHYADILRGDAIEKMRKAQRSKKDDVICRSCVCAVPDMEAVCV